MADRPHVQPARMIVLNGPSSAGKSTLGRALQRSLGLDAAFVSIDLLWRSIHPERPNDWQLFELLTGVLFDSALAFWKRGAHVVVDTVFERQECADACHRTLAVATPLYIGLSCDVAELDRRERARANRPLGLAARQVPVVHTFCRYDLRLDTTRTTVDASVVQVMTLLDQQVRARPE